MNEVLGYLVPGGMVFAGMLAIVLGSAAVLTWPRPLLFVFAACLVLMASSSSYGFEDATDSNVFWVKGTRSFFFSFVEMGLVGAWLGMLVRRAWHFQREPWLPMTKYYLGFAVMLMGHALAGLFDKDSVFIYNLSQRGYSNLLLQGMFVSLVVANLRSQRDLQLVALLLLCCLAGRHLYGLVRYAALGGDPQNAYVTLGGSKVKITFWDINDSILAAVMFALCAWRLLTEKAKSNALYLFLLAGAAMALIVPLLSARRTAQGGMLLAVCFLAWMLPRGRRWPVVIALAVSVPLVLFALGQRADSSQSSVVQNLLIDIKIDPSSDPRRSRFHELNTAWETIKKEPIFGLGPNGSFKVYDPTGLEYHSGRYDFVHSGFGHIFLKGGLAGLLLMMGLLLSWALYVRRNWVKVQGPARALTVAAIAGLLASVPNFVVGTPIPELRTMLLMGLLLALPVVAIRVAAQPTPKQAAQPTPKRNSRGVWRHRSASS